MTAHCKSDAICVSVQFFVYITSIDVTNRFDEAGATCTCGEGRVVKFQCVCKKKRKVCVNDLYIDALFMMCADCRSSDSVVVEVKIVLMFLCQYDLFS